MFNDEPVKAAIESLEDDDSPLATAIILIGRALLEINDEVMGLGADVESLQMMPSNR